MSQQTLQAEVCSNCGLSYSDMPVYNQGTGSSRDNSHKMTRQSCVIPHVHMGQMWDDTEAEVDSPQCTMTDGMMTDGRMTDGRMTDGRMTDGRMTDGR